MKIILTKVGLDGHDRGLKVVASMLRDAGMEVIYLGKFQTPASIAESANQEDVDVIGINCQSTNHVLIIPQIIALLKEKGMNDVSVVVGGNIPEPYASQLISAGVSRVFEPNSTSGEIVGYIKSKARKHD